MSRDASNVVELRPAKPAEKAPIDLSEPPRDEVVALLVASLIATASGKHRARLAKAIAGISMSVDPARSRVAHRALQIIGEN